MAAKRIRKTFSYEPIPDVPDLAEQIEKLRIMRNSPYSGRSFADIAGMILFKYVPEEINKYERIESGEGR